MPITKYLLASFLLACCTLKAKSQASLKTADSLFMAKDYQAAKLIYKKLLADTSTDALHFNRLGFCEYSTENYEIAGNYLNKALSLHPAPPLKASILSRLARTSAVHKNEKASEDYLDSAINNGYLAMRELDTVKDFAAIRNSERFKQIRNRIFNLLYPCYSNPRAEEFDFWIGEWNVYVTGTNGLAGHSLVEKVSGGCALLENWKSAASEGKSLNFIDDSTKKWKQVWIGSYAGGKQDFVDGEYTKNAMVFRFTTTNAGGQKMSGRFSFFNEGPGKVRQLNELSADGGKTWVVQYDFTYVRQK